jgi:hypothetical protein
MGCQQSHVKGGDSNARPHINPEHLPAVHSDSWYALPFTEETPMELTSFHSKHKGDVCFSSQLIPSRAAELQQLLPNHEPLLQTVFTLGSDSIFGMGYLHNTALYIEHYWRTRVAHTFAGDSKYDRPFYNMLIGIKVFINDQLIPDQVSGPDSLLQCTATIRAHEATSTWLCVPVILCPLDVDCTALSVVEVYRGLCLSFCLAAQTLLPGDHTVRIEVVYGCRAEANFCTDFIARGVCKLRVNDESSNHLNQLVDRLAALIEASASGQGRQQQQPGSPSGSPATRERETVILDSASIRPSACAFCSAPLKYVCTICGAHVCGSSSCVWSKFVGYPYGCQSHKAQF